MFSLFSVHILAFRINGVVGGVIHRCDSILVLLLLFLQSFDVMLLPALPPGPFLNQNSQFIM